MTVKMSRQHPAVFCFSHTHYCCTSFDLVSLFWIRAITATSNKELDRLRLPDAFPAGSAVECVVNIESQEFGHLGRRAVRQRQVLVKELKPVRQRQEGTDRDGRHDHRNGHVSSKSAMEFAPSIFAASISSPGIFWMPEI